MSLRANKWATLFLVVAVAVWSVYRAVRLRQPRLPPRVPVFVLHRVLPGEASEYVMTPEHLEKLLQALRREKFTPITLSQLRSALEGKGVLPRRPAMLTFDDAYHDFYVYAFPILRKYKWPAVLFVPVGKITDPPAPRVEWGAGPEPYAMQWPEIEEVRRSGVEIGSHAFNHINLAKADPEVVLSELAESRRILAERLGEPPIALAYPGGRQNREVRRAAAGVGYSMAFLSGGGPIKLREHDPLGLPRVHVPGYVDPAAIVRAVLPGRQRDQ